MGGDGGVVGVCGVGWRAADVVEVDAADGDVGGAVGGPAGVDGGFGVDGGDAFGAVGRVDVADGLDVGVGV